MERSSILQNYLPGCIGSNFIAISIIALIMYLFREYSYSRIVVFGTAGLATVFELLFGSAYIAYKKALVQDMKNTKDTKFQAAPANMTW